MSEAVSTEQVIRDLVALVQPERGPAGGLQLFWGTIQQAHTADAPWDVRMIDGGTIRASMRLSGSTWSRGDRVVIGRGGRSWVILGAIIV